MTCQTLTRLLPSTALLEKPALPFRHLGSGKVRELYDTPDGLLLILATDRISAYDAVLGSGIPGKGIILTQLSRFWFDRAASILPHHLASSQDERLRELLGDRSDLAHRCMLVRKLRPLPVEAVVRGYLAGSGWIEYAQTGQLFGHTLPAGLAQSSALPDPLFTPTTKAQEGHDEALTPDAAAKLLGRERFELVRELALRLYEMGAQRAREAGLILADTKFEFGEDEVGRLYLIDEVLTPDSSRFWPAEEYQPGRSQHAYDKQFVRDYVRSLHWQGSLPAPGLPEDVVTQTQERYLQAYRRLVEAS